MGASIQQLEQLLVQKREEGRLKALETRAIEEELNRARSSASAAALGFDAHPGDYQMSSSLRSDGDRSRMRSNMVPRTASINLGSSTELSQYPVRLPGRALREAHPPLTHLPA